MHQTWRSMRTSCINYEYLTTFRSKKKRKPAQALFLSRLKGIFGDIESLARAPVLSDAPPGAPQGDFSPEGLHASFNNPLAATKDASTAASAFQTLKV